MIFDWRDREGSIRLVLYIICVISIGDIVVRFVILILLSSHCLMERFT